MGLFGIGSTHIQLPYIQCGEQCKKCSTGRCTKQISHSTTAGHYSNSSATIEGTTNLGCGHTW